MTDDFGDSVVVSFPEYSAPFIDDGEELSGQGLVYVFNVFDSNEKPVGSERLVELIESFPEKTLWEQTFKIKRDGDFRDLYWVTQSNKHGVVRIVENHLLVGKFVIPVVDALKDVRLFYDAEPIIIHRNRLLAPISNSFTLADSPNPYKISYRGCS